MFGTSKQAIDVIKEKTPADKMLQDFLIEIHNYEVGSRGTWMNKEVYKQLIRKYSQKWEAEDEN